jgi:DNA-binding beta-propeller fold protein YncE
LASAHEGVDQSKAPPDAKSVTEAVVTGEGDNTYKALPKWCQIPENKPSLGPTHGGIVVDKAGNIYFSLDGGVDAAKNGLLVYKPDGTFIKGIAPGMTGMHGLAINEENGEEFIYAAHLAGKQAVKLKLDGTVVWKIGVPMESGKYEKAQYAPTGIAVAPDGSVFVADGYSTNWVHKFDKDQKYVKSFGGPGNGNGQFNTCHGLGIDKRGEKPVLLVCDRANGRLQHMDFDGNFIAVIATGLHMPCSVSFHGEHIAIAELKGRVTILDGKNKEVAHLGANPDDSQSGNFGVPPEKMKVGVFTAPHGVSYDKDANLYVMDWNASGRVSRLDRVADKK